MKKFFTCLLPLLLVACASAPPASRFTYYDAQTAGTRILELAGEEAPADIQLAPAYLEMWQKTSVNGDPWVCTGSRDLYGKTLLTITRLDGNRFRGVWAWADQCGHASRADLEGRYDDKYAYMHFAAGGTTTKKTTIIRYAIADGGRRLIEDENYTFKDGQPHRHVYARSGGQRDGNVYQTTDFLDGAEETPDQLLAQARLDLVQTKAHEKRREAANGFNWSGFAAGMAGIIADGRAQQQQAISNNERRQRTLQAHMQQQANARASEQAAALAQLQAKRQQANAQNDAQVKSRSERAQPVATQRARPAISPLADVRSTTVPAQRPDGVTVADTSAGTPMAAELSSPPQARHVFCQAHVPDGKGTKWLVTPLVKVHRHTFSPNTYQDDLDFRAFVAQNYGGRNTGTCEFRSGADQAATMRANALRSAESHRKNGNVTEIIHLTWAPRD